mmetsp:Transcript_19951/g.60408  ORF Transcript_19951/g.60408 Transcript_19951/m.60408 type:complete len:302 (+) Transcript_19951:338-1243(+)
MLSQPLFEEGDAALHRAPPALRVPPAVRRLLEPSLGAVDLAGDGGAAAHADAVLLAARAEDIPAVACGAGIAHHDEHAAAPAAPLVAQRQRRGPPLLLAGGAPPAALLAGRHAARGLLHLPPHSFRQLCAARARRRGAHGHAAVEHEILAAEEPVVAVGVEVAVDAALQLRHRGRRAAALLVVGARADDAHELVHVGRRLLAAHAAGAVHEHAVGAPQLVRVLVGPAGELAEAARHGVHRAGEAPHELLVVVAHIDEHGAAAAVTATAATATAISTSTSTTEHVSNLAVEALGVQVLAAAA